MLYMDNDIILKSLKCVNIRNERDIRIKNGYRVSWIRIIYTYPSGGCGIEEYELPFDKNIMDNDINEHIFFCLFDLINKNENIDFATLKKNHDSLEKFIQELQKRKLIKNDISINVLKEKYIYKEKDILPLSFFSKGIEEEI
jgi:hypothetical protein